MRIRRCASRLLGASPAPALPGFELPPPHPPPTAHESHGSFVAASGTCLEPCELSRSPWDLMAQLHPSDPQEEKLFLETYFVAVAWRSSWLFQPSMPSVGSIKEEEKDEADMVDGVIFELRVAARKKNGIKQKVKQEDGPGGGAPVWACKKNDGKRWFCRRPVSQPDSFCPYHSDQKPPAGITKPRKRTAAYAGEGFYYYAGFGPSRSKRHRVSSSDDTMPEPPPAEPKEAPPEEGKHIGFVTAGEAQADCAGHQPAAESASAYEPRCDDIAGIAGGDEESSDDDYVVQPRDIKMKSTPLKKRWRKPVKARSLKSLM